MIFLKNFIAGKGIVIVLMLFVHSAVYGRDIIFCGEIVPVDNDFVANKLMNVIRRQMPVANLPRLRSDARRLFPFIEQRLKAYGIPEDFKYLPIVESGFKRYATSSVGARGFWQLMPATAQDYGLMINDYLDERDNTRKATEAACRFIRDTYNGLKKATGNASWILTAAAYNNGSGNIRNAVRRDGNDYFQMNLVPETAEYVYKIIAIKELFEHPELYMKDFGGNVFSEDFKEKQSLSPTKEEGKAEVVAKEFSAITINTNKKELETLAQRRKDMKVTRIIAHLEVSPQKFTDGSLLTIRLENDLDLPSGFTRKGNVIKGDGWIVDGRVFVDVDENVVVLDNMFQKGIPLKDIANKEKKIVLETYQYLD